MKIFVLTDCAAEDNYTPRLFNSKEKAKEAFNKLINQLIKNADEGESVLEQKIYDDKAEITYTDETYDVIEIFEVEVEE